MSPGEEEIRQRVLVLAPTARDGEVTRGMLSRVGLPCITFDSLAHLSAAAEAGAGAILMTEEALADPGMHRLLEVLRAQPAWSEIPVVVLMKGAAQSAASAEALEKLGNVTLLERPAPMRSVISAVQAAVRGRQRQFTILEQIEAIRLGQQALAVSEERLQLAVQAARLGLWSLDLSTEQLTCSDACKANFGRQPADPFTYADFWASLHPDDRERVRATIQRVIDAHVDYDMEFRTLWPDGTVHWVIVRGRTAHAPDGRALALNGVTFDITERMRGEEERRQLLERERSARAEAERASRMKDEFLANLSHELRTPLNAILGWSQLLRRSGVERDELEEGLGSIERNARVQTQLIEDLLDMSRIVSGNLRLDIEPVDPITFIDAAIETVQPAAEAKAIVLQKVFDPNTGLVSGDASRLQQVVWNLLSNAIKFTPRGGQVRIVLERAAVHARLSITDTGRGIGASFLPFVFDRFRQADASTTRKYGGLGLGLSIVKHLVELHGGSVAVTSPGEGKGCTFIVELPLTVVRSGDAGANGTPRAEEEPAQPPRTWESLKGVSVLVVDDEADARGLLMRVLRECGADVCACASAGEALSVLETFRPHVLVSDIGMPALDGYEFLRRVRARHGDARLPAIALTAFARSEDRTRALRAGFLAHVPKPVEPAALIAIVASFAPKPGAAAVPNDSA